MDFFTNFFFGAFSKTGDPFVYDRKAAAALIFHRLLSLVINRFKYDKMPETMDARFLELCLINSGKAGVADRSGVRNFASIINGGFNAYGYPASASLIDYMGKSYGRIIPMLPGSTEYADGVIIYDSKTELPPIARVWWYANRLHLIQTALSVAIQNTRAGVVWETNSRAQTRAIERALKLLDQGKPYIITYGEENDLKDPPKMTANPQTPEILQFLQETYDKTLADFLTEYGINANAVINKLSGVGRDELEQNGEATRLALDAALDCRREGLERVNSMFGTSITVAPSFTTSPERDIMRLNKAREEGGAEDVTESYDI